MNKSLRNQIGILVVGSILIILAYQFVDKPIVFWANAHDFRQYTILKWFTHLSDIQFSLILIYPVVLLRFYYQKHSYLEKTLLAMANSIVITIFLKNVIKDIFGRYWAETWIHNNLSLLRNGVYGFKWFQASSAYASFPSGHVAVTVAAMTILWIAYPRFRWFSSLIVILMLSGQVLLYYHFLSDAIAGGLLGYLVASGVANMSGLRMQPDNISPRIN